MPLLQQPNCQRTSEPAKTRAKPRLNQFRCRMDRGQSHAAYARSTRREPDPWPFSKTLPATTPHRSPLLTNYSSFAESGKQMILAKSKHSSIGCCKNRKNNSVGQPNTGKKPASTDNTPENRLGETGPQHAVGPQSCRQSGSTARQGQPRPEGPNAIAANFITLDSAALWGTSVESPDNCLH
jgi:hypothetical protein